MTQSDSVNHIFPANLTARAGFNVPGNPPSTRPESGVGNCYPGLEYDHRNLDRRFFPGLVVAFVTRDEADARGGRVVDVDPSEAQPGELRQALQRLLATRPELPWFLAALAQGDRRIDLVDRRGNFLDGELVWRLVRSLLPGPVTVEVARRPPADADDDERVVLEGWRRRYTDADTGVLDAAYQPGELTQSLCSPWTHDFRDCSCTYWASNHPDIVLPPLPPGHTPLPGGRPAESRSDEVRLDWLRDPEFAELHSQALPSQRANRPSQIGYYQINHQWQDLAIVLEGREIGDLYVPPDRERDWAKPFDTAEELWKRVVELASVEHLVALMYLYAYSSVRSPGEAAAYTAKVHRWQFLERDVTFTRAELLEIAIGEMQHLRWAHQLLWGLADVTGRVDYVPSLVPATSLRDSEGKARRVVLSRLDPGTLERFVDLERSSAYIDGQYAQVTATLRDPRYPPTLHQIASTIAAQGEEHFLQFTRLQKTLEPYGRRNPVYLRPLVQGDPADPKVKAALDTYVRIAALLTEGYQPGDRHNQRAVATARALMFKLEDAAEALAKRGIGLPFLSVWQ